MCRIGLCTIYRENHCSSFSDPNPRYIWLFLVGVEYGNSTYGLSSNLRYFTETELFITAPQVPTEIVRSQVNTTPLAIIP